MLASIMPSVGIIDEVNFAICPAVCRQISELVTVFNHQVGNTGWTGMRAYHDHALIDEFQRRGIDISAIYDGNVISFAYPIRYDLPDNKLIAIG